MAHETIIPSAQITVNGEQLTVKIDHMLSDDEHEPYTGCYRATVNKYQIVNVELNSEGVWVESVSKEATELAKELGKRIEGYVE